MEDETRLDNICRDYRGDKVNSPSHYNQGIEAIDYIESHNMNFNLGNVIKYVTRCEHKEDKLKYLNRAKWYIQREIDAVNKK